MLEKYTEALADQDAAIRLNSNKASYYADRAYTRERMGQIEEAEADYAHARALDPVISRDNKTG